MLIAADLILLLLWIKLAVSCTLGILAKRPKRVASGHGSARVSVVVPAFNEEQDLGQTLSALLSQSLLPWEIIVVDDGSEDRTADVARECLDAWPSARVIRLSRNSGKAAALNAGVGAATGELIATVDADTRLQHSALAAALKTMSETRADAVAFHVDVDCRGGFIGQLQQQEYTTSLNFERAGQSLIGAISILPGAATLFRRDTLLAHPFSARSWTEDADLTLNLGRQGVRLVVADRAVASTLVPQTLTDLMAQRTRWIAGHLQCCLLHCAASGGTRIFRAITLPNFVVSTCMAIGGCLALGGILFAGRTPLLGLEWLDAVTISLLVVYVQRASAWALNAARGTSLRSFLFEPIFTGTVSTACFLNAVWALHQRRRPR